MISQLLSTFNGVLKLDYEVKKDATFKDVYEFDLKFRKHIERVRLIQEKKDAEKAEKVKEEAKENDKEQAVEPVEEGIKSITDMFAGSSLYEVD